MQWSRSWNALKASLPWRRYQGHMSGDMDGIKKVTDLDMLHSVVT